MHRRQYPYVELHGGLRRHTHGAGHRGLRRAVGHQATSESRPPLHSADGAYRQAQLCGKGARPQSARILFSHPRRGCAQHHVYVQRHGDRVPDTCRFQQDRKGVCGHAPLAATRPGMDVQLCHEDIRGPQGIRGQRLCHGPQTLRRDSRPAAREPVDGAHAA